MVVSASVCTMGVNIDCIVTCHLQISSDLQSVLVFYVSTF